jgi:uncharacterized membrane protein
MPLRKASEQKTAPVEQRTVVISLAIVLWILASLGVIIVIRQCPVSPADNRMVIAAIRGLFYLAFAGVQASAIAFVLFMIRRYHSSHRDPPVRGTDSLHHRHPGT